MWAKIINDEIMQMSDENPEGLWHPDFLQFWQEVPEHVHIGWKFKNGEWISGSQWWEEFQAENPVPPPGPPTASINFIESQTESTVEVTFLSNSAGIIDEGSEVWIINGDEYKETTVTLTFNKIDKIQVLPISLTISGPGGSSTKEEKLKINMKVSEVPIA